MPLVVTVPVADRQVVDMAVAAFAQWLDMFKRCISYFDMQAAHPARHLAVQLPGDGFVNFQAGVGWFAHELIDL